jgi:hypothetical protein
VLVLELYLPKDIVKNAPARYGSAMLLGSIDIKADTFITTGLFMVNDGAKIRANNIGLAGRFVVNNGDATLSAVYDIVNVGTTRVAGNLYLNACHDIKELILINPAHPVQELTKRAIYAIGGSLYYKAEHDIIQQGSVIFASGDVVMNAGHDIVIESVHQSRVVKEERSRKHYIIHSTVDQFDAVIMVNGKVEMTAGHNFIGSGVKLLASTGDVRINAGESVVLEDKTGYAWSHGSKTKNKFLGTSKVSVSWTTDKTAQVEITAPGGAVYISSKECTLEGGRIDGKKPIFKCDKLLIKPHKVTKRIETTRKEDGLIATKLPVGDLINSDHPEKHLRDNTIAGQINDLINMQGPLDLLPAVNVISPIPGLKANYNLLKGKQTEFSPAALIGALLGKYISAGISIGNQKTSTTVTQITNTLSQINGEECEFTGNDLDIAANVKCKDKLKIEANNLKLQGAKDTLEIDSTTESSGIDINLGLSGLSFAVSFGDGNVQQTKEQHKAGTYHATNISIKVNNKLEIENAQINGKNVKVETLILEIKQVIDSSRTEGENSGISLGVNIGFDGGLTPIASLSHSESLQQTQVIQFLSGISGETVEVTAKSLEYNVAAITATQDLDIRAENINYIALPRTENIDTETQFATSITPRADGKSSYFASLYNRDGNKVMSMGWSSDLIEGIKDIIGGAESLLGKNDDGMNYKPLNQEPDQQEPKPESKPKAENNPTKSTSGKKTENGGSKSDDSANKDSSSKTTTPIPNDAEKCFETLEDSYQTPWNREQQDMWYTPTPKQSYKHGWVGETSDNVADAVNGLIDKAVDVFFKFIYELGKSVAQNNPLHENTIIVPEECKPEYSQGIRNVVNEGFEVIGTVTNEALKSAYSSCPTDVFLESSELKERIAQRRLEYDQAINYVGQKLNEHTTYGERRLVELGLTLTAVGKVAFATVEVGLAGATVKVVTKVDKPNIKPHTDAGGLDGKLGAATHVQDHYLEAMNGGKHAPWAKLYIDKPYKEIEKGIKSFEKQIELHQEKIKNPDKYIAPNTDLRKKSDLVNNKWPADIARHKELKNILEGILNERSKK